LIRFVKQNLRMIAAPSTLASATGCSFDFLVAPSGVYVADDGLPALATSVLLERLNLCGGLLRDGAEETALWPAGL
jgi:hypothetical protein